MPVDVGAALANLRLAGAPQIEPLQWHHLQDLAHRAASQSDAVKRILGATLAKRIAELDERLARAQNQPKENTAQVPESRLGALGHLARYASQQSMAQVGTPSDKTDNGPSELKSVRAFRKTWSQLSVDKQLNQALGQAPKNAGPINSHMLVLRSLALMRDLSPDYLNRFMSYVDALQCLDVADQVQPPGAPQVPQDDKGKKPRAPRKTSRAPAKREK
jgi:hypothetical protein